MNAIVSKPFLLGMRIVHGEDSVTVRKEAGQAYEIEFEVDVYELKEVKYGYAYVYDTGEPGDAYLIKYGRIYYFPALVAFDMFDLILGGMKLGGFA